MEKTSENINDVLIHYPAEMPRQEALEYAEEQLGIFPSRKLAELDISLEGDQVRLEPHYDSIVRVRRITGYLSTMPRFNQAKKEETQRRIAHLEV